VVPLADDQVGALLDDRVVPLRWWQGGPISMMTGWVLYRDDEKVPLGW